MRRVLLFQVTGSEFEVGPEFRLQTLLEIGMVDKKEVKNYNIGPPGYREIKSSVACIRCRMSFFSNLHFATGDRKAEVKDERVPVASTYLYVSTSYICIFTTCKYIYMI